jgi:ADP-heptose:LPS heptosyltransferase
MMKKDMPDKSMNRFLVIMPNNLGDVIMTTPILQGIKRQSPHPHITFLVESGFDGGILNNPHCDAIMRFPRKTIRDALWRGDGKEGLYLLNEQISQLRLQYFEYVLNFSQHAYLSFLTTLIKADTCRGQHFLADGNHAIDDSWSQYLYAIPFARRFNRLHATDVYRRIADIHQQCDNVIAVADGEKKAAADYLLVQNFNPDSHRIAVFQPGAALAAKRWPADHFVKLGNLLCQSGWRIVISGAQSEVDLANGIAARIDGDVVVTAGVTTFRQAIANLSFATCCVTADTALMHAAAAMKITVYALFGSTNPVETGPYGSGHWVFSGGCSDRPCFCAACKSMLCMKSIAPETVFSCISKGEAGARPGCDIFRTGFSAVGDYLLQPISPGQFSYYSESGAALTQQAFETSGTIPPSDNEEFQIHLNDTRQFMRALQTMRNELDQFVRSGDPCYISEFERKKNDLVHFKGIGEFWTALVNLRLNSVPLLNPQEGINRSAAVCTQTVEQLENLLNRVVS